MPHGAHNENRVIHLPKEAYTSQAWFDREMRDIFGRNWQFAGFVEDLAEPGDYLVAQAGPYSLLVVKGRDQRLRAFHNMCRHRGTQLLRTCGKAQKAITCPYHDWTYSLNGELIGVPQHEQEFPDLDKRTLPLHKAKVETWLGMIWVHPDPDAVALPHWLEGVQDWIGPHRPEELIEYPEGATDHTIQANWKIVVENYIDGYHLAHLHSSTLNMYDHQQQVTGFCGPHFYFYEPLSETYQQNLEKMSPLPLIDHFTGAHPIGAYVPMLFPALGIGASESSWSIFQVIPLAPDQTRVITRTRVMNLPERAFAKQAARSAPHYAKMAGKYPDGADDDPMNSLDFMAEDIYVCEQQQRSLASPLFSVGATARYQEASVRGFQKRVLQALDQARTDTQRT